MKRFALALAGILCLVQTGLAQAQAGISDTRDFELTPVAPPVPALKYELLFDPLDRRPGNAALLYFQAEALMGQEYAKRIADAEDAYQAKDDAKFTALATKLDYPSVQAILDLAGRCDFYDREAPLHERGSFAMLPYLNTSRVIADWLEVRAIAQVRTGQVDDAIQSLRLGLELGRKVGSEPVLVSGLVGCGIIAVMSSEPMTELMNRPDAPNLYWALASLPRPLISFQRAMTLERIYVVADLPELADPHLDDFSGQQWRDIFDKAVSIAGSNSPAAPANEGAWANPQVVAEEVNHTLPRASEYYAQSHHLSADQVQQLDPFQVVAAYWYHEYQVVNDDYYKLTAFPYPLAITKMNEAADRFKKLQTQEPANVFLFFQASLNRAAVTFARVDRMLAALTAVEAIRSYAAANGGKLPAALADITDTPVLDNPATGKPFDYAIQGDSAILSDQSLGLPLKYTIRIRK